MVTKITSISLQEEDLDIILRFNLSPTALIKEKLAEFRNISSVSMELLEEKQKKIARLVEQLQKAIDFITENGLSDKFLGL